MFRLSGTVECPPGGWMYKIEPLSVKSPNLAWVGPFTSHDDLVNEVVKRCKANGLPVPSVEAIDDQICQRSKGGFCVDDLGQPMRRPGSGAIGASSFVQATKTLFAWWLHGSVDENEIVRRSYICNQCPENRPISGCSSCALKDAHEVINRIVASRRLPTDGMLHACTICSCSLVAKTRMKVDDILPHMSQEQKSRLPEKCWLVAPMTNGADVLT